MPIKAGITFAEWVARLTRGYVKHTGKQPDGLAKLKIKMEAAERVKRQNVVTEFPKDRITDPFKPRPTEEELLEAEYRRLKSLSPEEVKAEMRKEGLTPVEERPHTGGIEGVKQQMDKIKGISDELKKIQEGSPYKKEGIEKIDVGEVIPKESSMTKDKFFRIKQGLSTQIKLNTLPQNKHFAKELITRKNAEFNSLNETGKKEILDRLNIRIKNEQAGFATPIEPDDFASGGLARVGMAGGGILKEFIERLFIKASNDIRRGKGKWAGLDEKQRIVQHDNLTKKVMEFQKSGKTEGLEEYFGVDPNTAFIAARDKVKRRGIKKDFPDDPVKTTKLTRKDLEKITKEDIDKGFKEEKALDDFFTGGRGPYQAEADEILKQNKGLTDDQIMQKAYDEIHGGSGFTDDYKMNADLLAEQYALQKGVVYTDLPQNQISIYYEPALKRVTQNLKARMEAKKALKDVHQKIELQRFDPKGRKPNASGGIAGQLHLNNGGPVNQQALIQMYMEEGLSYDDAVAAASSLNMDTLFKGAEGGLAKVLGV